MSKKKKGISLVGLVLFFILLIAIIIGGFVYSYLNNNGMINSKEAQNEEKAQNEVANISEEEKEKSEEVYFGISDFFIGTYENTKWYSASAYSGNSFYTVNMPSKVIEKKFEVEELESLPGLYGFDQTGFLGKQKEGNIIYSEGEEEYRTIDTIRLKYDEILLDLDESKSKAIIVSSKNASPFTSNVEIETEENFMNYENYVKAVLDSKNLSNTKVSILNVLKGDFDLDQIEEYIIVAQTERNEDGKFIDQEGAYSFVIWVEGNDVSILMERIRTKEELAEEDIANYYSIEEVFITDMNKNGNIELIVQTGYWDIPEVYMFEFDGERFELIAYGNYAW